MNEIVPSNPSAPTPVPYEDAAKTVAGDALLAPNTAAPPVAAQRSSHTNAAKLQSEKVVVSAPLSFHGSAARIWKIVGMHDHPAYRISLGTCAAILIAIAWTFVLAWYALWFWWLVPYRMIRRGSRSRKRQALQHREMMAAIQTRSDDS